VKLTTIGVVGAGVIGSGVTQVLARAGYSVLLVDVSEEILQEARQEVAEGLRLSRLFGGEYISRKDAVTMPLRRISLHTGYDALTEADFVIENVPEDPKLKEQVFADLDRVCPDRTILATNTSCVPVASLAAGTGRPDRVLGIHFMNPVPMTRGVELIRTRHTSDETLRTASDLLLSLEKEWTVVNDSPGFVINRVLMLVVNEASALVQEGVASPEEVDKIFKTCLGHPMGPLETADMIGLDTVVRSLEVLHKRLGRDRYRPSSLLQEKVADGHLGRKSGQGFFRTKRT